MADKEEDLNAFNVWDSAGAVVMLGIAPAAMVYVFNDHDVVGAAMCAGIALLAGAATYLAGVVFPGRALGRIVNFVACVLTPVYIIVAIWLWGDKVKRDIPNLTPMEEPAEKAQSR